MFRFYCSHFSFPAIKSTKNCVKNIRQSRASATFSADTVFQQLNSMDLKSYKHIKASSKMFPVWPVKFGALSANASASLNRCVILLAACFFSRRLCCCFFVVVFFLIRISSIQFVYFSSSFPWIQVGLLTHSENGLMRIIVVTQIPSGFVSSRFLWLIPMMILKSIYKTVSFMSSAKNNRRKKQPKINNELSPLFSAREQAQPWFILWHPKIYLRYELLRSHTFLQHSSVAKCEKLIWRSIQTVYLVYLSFTYVSNLLKIHTGIPFEPNILCILHIKYLHEQTIFTVVVRGIVAISNFERALNCFAAALVGDSFFFIEISTLFLLFCTLFIYHTVLRFLSTNTFF